ncbi:MAG TPA: hypothetical protein VKT28_19665 [Puia sp.]|nr:hypothetical protein [Puia sp.]
MKNKTYSFGRCILTIVIIFLSIESYSQDQSLKNIEAVQPAFTSSSDLQYLMGERIYNNKAGTDANVLLYPNWQRGVVNFSNGKQLSDVELEFNLARNELYFKNNDRPNLFADPVKSFYIIDTSNGVSKIAFFSNGYPNLDHRTNKAFYLVLNSGAALHLLKYVSVKKEEQYEYGSASKTVYDLSEDLIVYDVKSNSLKAIKNNISSLIKALPAYTSVIQKSLAGKKSYLTDSEILAIVQQVNNAIL